MKKYFTRENCVLFFMMQVMTSPLIYFAFRYLNSRNEYGIYVSAVLFAYVLIVNLYTIFKGMTPED